MKKILLLSVFFTFSFSAFTQLYTGSKKWNTYFFEIKDDSAHIEVYVDSDQSFVLEELNEEIVLIKKDTLASFSNLRIVKEEDAYYALWKAEDKKKFQKIALELTEIDNRKEHRRKAYMSILRIDLFNILDSLSGPEKYIEVDINEAYLTLADKELPDSTFFNEAILLKHNLTKIIKENQHPKVRNTYLKIDSLGVISASEINNLLAETNYTFFYGDILLVDLSKKNPKALIDYLDSNPENKKVILQKIKNHEQLNLIVENVAKVTENSVGKTEILEQKQKMEQKKKIKKIAHSALIVAEVGMLTAVIIWFAKRK